MHGFTSTETILLGKENYGKYLHIKAVDRAGNIGPVTSIKLEMKYDNNITNSIQKTATANSVNKETNRPVLTRFEDKVRYNIKNSIEITNYMGKVVVSIVDKLPAKIDTSKSYLANGNYDSINQTITWNYVLNDINEYNFGKYSKTFNITIDLYYTNIADLTANLENTVTSTTTIYHPEGTSYLSGNKLGEKTAKDSSIVEQNYITQIAGKVWLDNNRNGQFGDSQDKAMPGMTVILHQNVNGKDTVIKQTTTDKEGNYLFSNLDGLGKYFVEFKYNGQYYEPTKYKF